MCVYISLITHKTFISKNPTKSNTITFNILHKFNCFFLGNIILLKAYFSNINLKHKRIKSADLLFEYFIIST